MFNASKDTLHQSGPWPEWPGEQRGWASYQTGTPASSAGLAHHQKAESGACAVCRYRIRSHGPGSRGDRSFFQGIPIL